MSGRHFFSFCFSMFDFFWFFFFFFFGCACCHCHNRCHCHSCCQCHTVVVIVTVVVSVMVTVAECLRSSHFCGCSILHFNLGSLAQLTVSALCFFFAPEPWQFWLVKTTWPVTLSRHVPLANIFPEESESVSLCCQTYLILSPSFHFAHSRLHRLFECEKRDRIFSWATGDPFLLAIPVDKFCCLEVWLEEITLQVNIAFNHPVMLKACMN